uniref:Alpha-1,3/1,6-mannosyltransferase ALG2 n=1 Tax=Aceria tosichella TaxID=561515 RepID=A0A6G1SRG3_9ACAR
MPIIKQHRVAVIHPDLGVGGAERLIVDASKALKECGHQVTIYTGYHDRMRCFDETRDGTLNTVTLGQWIPRTIFGRFHALMAYLKMIYIAFYLLFFSNYDLVLCDQVSACIPFLRLNLWANPKIIFYCHFPDQLLTKRESLMKAAYRKPLDLFEEWSTSLADSILVNSKFTRNVVQQTFKSLRNRELIVLYPCVDLDHFIKNKPSDDDCETIFKDYDSVPREKFIYLSLNRFERKKALATAIESLSVCLFKLKHEQDKLQLNEKGNKKEGMHLIVAGGYDSRLKDSVDYYAELKQLTQDLDLVPNVTFIESPSDGDKLKLLQICNAVVYTPENEHFGIVPLEAMAMSRPVIASASGGPLETIEDGVNGFLCSHDNDDSFPNAMLELYADQVKSDAMGSRGFIRVKKDFSYQAFRDHLNRVCFPPGTHAS